MKLTAVIDRFESDKVVLLLRKNTSDAEIPVVWPKKFLPAAKEGDILNISFETDKVAAEKALAENENLLQDILSSQNR